MITLTINVDEPEITTDVWSMRISAPDTNIPPLFVVRSSGPFTFWEIRDSNTVIARSDNYDDAITIARNRVLNEALIRNAQAATAAAINQEIQP